LSAPGRPFDLFFPVAEEEQDLRRYVRDTLLNHELIQRCHAGEQGAARALHRELWNPYIKEFGERVNAFKIGSVRADLAKRFGKARTRSVFTSMVFSMRRIAEEETDHARLWEKSAKELGTDLDRVVPLRSVERLILATNTTPPVTRLATLMNIEFIAEEVAGHLSGSPQFNSLFSNSMEWPWGVEHTREHEGIPHWLVYRDLAFAVSGLNEQETSKLVGLVAWSSTHLHAEAFSEITSGLPPGLRCGRAARSER
jgi:hypothetical protein